jgi:hypothetical protein
MALIIHGIVSMHDSISPFFLGKFMRLLILILCFTVWTSEAYAKVIAECGSSEGYAYRYNPPDGTSNWAKDSVSKGNFSLVKEGNKFDIVYTDAMGVNSARNDGGDVLAVNARDGNYVFIVNNPGQTVSTFVFRLRSDGKSEVTWSTARYNSDPQIDKHNVMRASCKSLVR